MKTLKLSWNIAKGIFFKFQEDDPMSHSAAIAFYTLFSLPGILIVVISLAGFLWGEEATAREVYQQVNELIGPDSARMVRRALQDAQDTEAGTIATIIGIAILLFSSTTVFIAIQGGLNKIWSVHPKPKRGWLKLIMDRLSSLAMVVALGILLMLSLLIDATLLIIRNHMEHLFPDITLFMMQGASLLISLVLLTVIFGLIFEFLPDANLKWQDVWTGGLFTAILFIIGKVLIGFYLSQTDIGSSYGAAGSLVAILMWVYYSSLIVLIGGEFTQVRTRLLGRKIAPSKNAVKVETREISHEEFMVPNA